MNKKIQTLLQIIPKELNRYHNFGKYTIWNGETTTFLEYKIGTLVTVLGLIDRRRGTCEWTSHVKMPEKDAHPDSEKEKLLDAFIDAFSS